MSVAILFTNRFCGKSRVCRYVSLISDFLSTAAHIVGARRLYFHADHGQDIVPCASNGLVVRSTLHSNQLGTPEKISTVLCCALK